MPSRGARAFLHGIYPRVDGSKFRAVSSAKHLRQRDAVNRLEQLDAAEAQDEVVIDSSAVQAALEKLKSDPEPEARFMRTAKGFAPAYNVQTAVDAEHADRGPESDRRGDRQSQLVADGRGR
jgi:hypothetical protein